MQIIKIIIGSICLIIALAMVLSTFGILGASEESILDSPQASGQLIGNLIPAAILGAIGAWLWQKPK